MSVVVDTGVQEIADANVHTAHLDENQVIIDTTAEDIMDKPVPPAPAKTSPIVEDRPPPQKKPEPAPIFSAEEESPSFGDEDDAESDAPPTPKKEAVKKKKKRPATPPKKKKKRTPPRPAKAEEAENVFSALDDNPSFARAMRSTLPKEPDAVETMSMSDFSEASREDDGDYPAAAATRKRPRSPTPPGSEQSAFSDSANSAKSEGEDEEKIEDDARSSASGGSSAEGGEEEEEGEEEVDEDAVREDEYIEKMKIIEEIKGYAKMGILPPNPPALSMPLRMLRKIRDYMSSKADEIMGVGMIGTAWIQIVGLIEKMNGQYDPFAKIFGMGLKLTGAKHAVTEKIHLYEAVFKHIYSKLPKSKELNPWIQFGMVTMQIFAEVHINNLRQEMEAEAREMARDPRTRQDAEAVREMFEERERQRKSQRQAKTGETPAVRRTPAPPQPTMKPPPEGIEDETEDEAMEKPMPASPVPKTPPNTVEEGDEEIDVKQPPPPEDTKIGEEPPGDEGESGSASDSDDEAEKSPVTSAAEEDEDEDDVVVQLPATKKRGGSKKQYPAATYRNIIGDL